MAKLIAKSAQVSTSLYSNCSLCLKMPRNSILSPSTKLQIWILSKVTPTVQPYQQYAHKQVKIHLWIIMAASIVL